MKLVHKPNTQTIQLVVTESAFELDYLIDSLDENLAQRVSLDKNSRLNHICISYFRVLCAIDASSIQHDVFNISTRLPNLAGGVPTADFSCRQ